MKIFKQLATLIVTLAITASLFIMPANAAASTIISFSKNSPSVGESVTVSVTVNSDQTIYNATLNLNYNSDVLKFVSTDAGLVNSADAGIVKISPNPNSAKATYKFTFSTIKSGSSPVSVSGGIYTMDEDLSVGASATLTVKDAAKSSNANLKSLSLSSGSLSPRFSAAQTNYTAKVENSVTSCKIYATAADGGSKVDVSGSAELKVGSNTRKITVTAPSGAQKVYTVIITRLEENEELEETNPEEETPEVNPYETVIDGVTYTVSTDISAIKLPNGFTAKKADFNEAEVAVAEDAEANYTIYYLKAAEGSDFTPYTLSNDGKTFNKLSLSTFGSNTYILADFPDDKTASDEYYETTLKLGENNVKAFLESNSDNSDFYYICCFFDGDYNIYCYDKKENSLQRSPYFKLIDIEETDDLAENAGFLERFNSLSTNSKVVTVGFLIAVLGVLALVVLFVSKLFKKENRFDDENTIITDDFDEVSVTNTAVPDAEAEDEE